MIYLNVDVTLIDNELSRFPLTIMVKEKFFFILTFLVGYSFSDENSVSIDQIFDPNSGEVFLQRKYVVNIPAKSEECYYVGDVIQGQKLNFHYLVIKS